jgi:hypothetical protein
MWDTLSSLLVYTVPLILMPHVNSELADVFTLHNENKIYCLTSDERIPMYVLPPVDEESKQQLTLLKTKDLKSRRLAYDRCQ